MSTRSGRSITVIEDEPDILELIVYNLEREGYRVTAVPDGQEGLERVRRQPPDLLLLDLMLPGLDGLEMVFQKSSPFPMSVYENVVYSLRVDGVRDRRTLDAVCEKSLRGAFLWDEVKDRLQDSALGLSGGQQQRLCIARAIAAEPEVLLMDEPCSALDPIATGRIEELIQELQGEYTILIVTHNMQQAARASDYCAFMYLGRLVEYGPTAEIFTRPRLPETEDYVTGRFG